MEVDVDLDAAAEGSALVLGDCERAVRLDRQIHCLSSELCAWSDLDEIGDEVDGVETDAELSDEVHVAALLHSSRNAEVPDLAMVPRFSLSSAWVMPTPRSRMDSTPFSLSTLILMSRLASSPAPRTDSSVRERI